MKRMMSLCQLLSPFLYATQYRIATVWSAEAPGRQWHLVCRWAWALPWPRQRSWHGRQYLPLREWAQLSCCDIHVHFRLWSYQSEQEVQANDLKKKEETVVLWPILIIWQTSVLSLVKKKSAFWNLVTMRCFWSFAFSLSFSRLSWNQNYNCVWCLLRNMIFLFLKMLSICVDNTFGNHLHDLEALDKELFFPL